MYHLLAFSETSAGLFTNEDLSPVPDGIFVIQNSHFVPQQDHYLYAAMYMALTATRCRIVTPNVRQITRPYIRPVEAATIPGSRASSADWRMAPLVLKGLEDLAVEATHTTAGGTRATVLLAINRTALEPAPNGPMFTMRGTSTSVATANAWTQIAVIWEDTLPVGVYKAVGIHGFSANGQAIRGIYEDQVYRPGCPMNTVVADQEVAFWQKGGMGVHGQFNANRMPNFEVLCNGADAVFELYLDFIRVG